MLLKLKRRLTASGADSQIDLAGYAAIPDLIDDGKNGLLIDPFDLNELTEKLKKLIEDEKLRSTIGVQAYTDFKNQYSFEIFERNLLNVFDKIVS